MAGWIPPHCPFLSWWRTSHSIARAMARRRKGFHGLCPTSLSARSSARKKFCVVISSRERGGREPELVQRRLGRRADGRPVRGEQGERHYGAARPARHGVDVDREPGREQHQLDRQRGQSGPGELPEVGEPEAREDAGAGEAAVAQDEVAGPRERRLVRLVAGQLRGEVRLDRGREVARAARVLRPAPVRLLEGEQALGHAPVEVRPLAPEHAVEEDVLGLHGHVRLERRVPVAVGVLRRRQVLRGARDRLPRARPEPAVRGLRAADQDEPSFAAHAALPSSAVPTRTTMVSTCRLRSVAATRSGSAASAMTAPPAPPPVSLAPSAPAPRAAAATASTSGADTPSASSNAWFSSKARPRAARSPTPAARAPASTTAAT